jgi:hypothetical protein
MLEAIPLPGTAGALKRANRALGDLRLFRGLSGFKLNLYHTDIFNKDWLRDLDLNQGPSGYEPDELPGCSTPRRLCYVGGYCCLMVFFDGVFWRGFLLDRLDDLAATYSPVP